MLGGEREFPMQLSETLPERSGSFRKNCDPVRQDRAPHSAARTPLLDTWPMTNPDDNSAHCGDRVREALTTD